MSRFRFKGKRENKYKAKKVVVDGIVFDSTKEARRYNELKLLERAGEIIKLELQPSFTLQPSFRDKDGKFHRAIIYKADFRYIRTRDGLTIVEDTKGFKTEVYKIKKKLLHYKYKDINFVEL